MPVETAKQEQAKSTLVFLGQVASIEERSSQMDKNALILAWQLIAELFSTKQTNDPERIYKRVSFEVKQTTKGAASSHVQLSTGMGGGDCGYPFEVGKDYWVYASGTDAALTVSLCSLTGPKKPHLAK